MASPAGMPAQAWPVFQKRLTLELQPVSSLEARSPLPEVPDAPAVEELVLEIQTEFLFG